jgi:hypothetical protein
MLLEISDSPLRLKDQGQRLKVLSEGGIFVPFTFGRRVPFMGSTMDVLDSNIESAQPPEKD